MELVGYTISSTNIAIDPEDIVMVVRYTPIQERSTGLVIIQHSLIS